MNYRWINRRDRLEAPAILGAAGFEPVDWEVALEGAARVLKGKRLFVLASPNLSNEALFLLSRLTEKTGGAGAFRVPQGAEAPLAGVEDLALRADRAANARGAELLGFTRSEQPLTGLQRRRRAADRRPPDDARRSGRRPRRRQWWSSSRPRCRRV